MRAGDLEPEPTRVGQQVHITAAQPARTAVSTPLIRDGERAGAAPGPASTTAEPSSAASAPEAGAAHGPATS
jgi:hypothetical protein